MINAVTIIGRLGNDPELKTTDSGTSIVNFRLAFNEFRQQNGERKQIAHWFDCVAFGSMAQLCSEFLHKGAKVGVHGTLKQRTWQTDEGQNRNKVEITIRDLDFLTTNGKTNQEN